LDENRASSLYEVHCLSRLVYGMNLVGVGTDANGLRGHLLNPSLFELPPFLPDKIEKLVGAAVRLETMLVPVISKPDEHRIAKNKRLGGSRWHPVPRGLSVMSCGDGKWAVLWHVVSHRL
jgi:hypothetical protein